MGVRADSRSNTRTRRPPEWCNRPLSCEAHGTVCDHGIRRLQQLEVAFRELDAMGRNEIGPEKAHVVQVLDGGLAVLPGDELHFLGSLREMDRHQAAEIVCGGAHRPEKLRRAGIRRMWPQHCTHSTSLSFVPLHESHHLVEAGRVVRVELVTGHSVGAYVGRPGRRTGRCAVGTDAQFLRDIEEHFHVRGEIVDKRRGAALQNIQHPQRHEAADFRGRQRLERNVAHRHEHLVDQAGHPRGFEARVVGHPAEHRAIDNVRMEIDEAWKDEALLHFDRLDPSCRPVLRHSLDAVAANMDPVVLEKFWLSAVVPGQHPAAANCESVAHVGEPI